MKKNLTELVFILDRSGSMSGLESDTIGGFNAMIAKQKREEGEALVSTVLFDNDSVDPRPRAHPRGTAHDGARVLHPRLYGTLRCRGRCYPPHRQCPQVRP